ncbi:hypothetical protein RDV64_15500 [Acuticoccus sp. MNP-M23]|uniref:hypothetical protein n=1 Tax=Acuticoccus sp. MNP-M23 TaxID=3072793 RepID=UPI0028167D3F|nr:hypothetical protein [Acuticoccus sp. MNP-M23]WMS41479.1 hypothetical protein RDV64_15500 [Acuticoccus sp. MNP-M23]
MNFSLFFTIAFALPCALSSVPAWSGETAAALWASRLDAALDAQLKPLAFTTQSTGDDVLVHAQPACAPSPEALAIVLKAVPAGSAEAADAESSVLFSPTGAITEATALFAEPLTAVTITVFEGSGHDCATVPVASELTERLQSK